MHMLCELFRKMFNNSTQIYGACYPSVNTTTRKYSSNPQSLPINFRNNFEKYSTTKHSNVSEPSAPVDDKGAALFIVIVICFYSLSIVFMVILNIKFKMVINKKSDGGISCCEGGSKHDLYESQKDETKNTIQILFNDSSRLLASVVIPPNILNCNELNPSTIANKSKTNNLETTEKR